MKQSTPAHEMFASGDYLAAIRDFALSKGIAPTTLLEGSEISLEDLINPPVLVKNFLFNGIGQNLYQALPDPVQAAIEFGLSMTSASHGSLAIAVQCAPNVATAYRTMADYYNTRINTEDLILSHTPQGLEAELTCKVNDPKINPNVLHFLDLATFVSIAKISLSLLNLNTLSGVLRLDVNRPEPHEFPWQIIPDRLDLVFNQAALKLSIPDEWLDASLSVSNPELAKIAEQKCADELTLLTPQDIVTKVVQTLHQAGTELPSLEQMAQLFYMSPATFKRRLKAQNSSYQALKNKVRLEQASHLIQTGTLSMEAIAMQLGFSDASNFTKAFKSWSGMSPKAFRDQHDRP